MIKPLHTGMPFTTSIDLSKSSTTMNTIKQWFGESCAYARTRKIFAVLILLFALMANALAQSTVTYNSSGTWTAPAGVTQVTVEVWGGGGAGGNATSNPSAAGGGGGGAYSRSVLTVIPGTVYNYHVGAGGSNGGNGGDSYFESAGTLMAKGGTGVAANAS